MNEHERPGVPAWGGFAPVAAAVAACLVCLGALAWLRAGWLDEYWSLWYTDPANPLSVAYHARWLRDTQHPPTFYAFGWSLAPLIGDTIVWRRLIVNGSALLFIIPTMLACRRDRVSPQQPGLYLLMMAAGPFLITYFAEYRSYFLGMTATACLVAVTRRLHMNVAQERRSPVGLLVLFCILTLIAGNLHYTMSLCAFAFLGCECLWQWFRASRSIAVLIAAAVACALVPLVVNLLCALSVASPTPVVYQSLLRGWTIIATVVLSVPLSNVVLSYRAARATGGLRDAPVAISSFILVLAASLTLIVLGFLIMHALTHNMFPRLVLGLIPVATALVCELATIRAVSPRILILASINAVLAATLVTVVQLRNHRWETSVPAIQAALAACPSTRVIAVPPLRFAYEQTMMTGQADAMALSYRMIARKYGFPVETVIDERVKPSGDRRCPTLIWLEQNFVRPDITPQQLYTGVVGGPVPAASRLRMTRDGEHFLLYAMP